MYTNGIPGYVVMNQLLWLKDKASEMDSVAEVGCWKGRSTHALATGCKGKVYTVDTFGGTKGEEDWFKDKDTAYEQCKNNLKDFKNVTIYNMPSIEGSKIVPEVDMIFIDGDHSYEGVKEDIKAWLPKVKKLICGHDIGRAVVQRAVEDTIGDYEQYDNIWFKYVADIR